MDTSERGQFCPIPGKRVAVRDGALVHLERELTLCRSYSRTCLRESGSLFDKMDWLTIAIAIAVFACVIAIVPEQGDTLATEMALGLIFGFFCPRYWGRVINVCAIVACQIVYLDGVSYVGILFGVVCYEIGLTAMRFVNLKT